MAYGNWGAGVFRDGERMRQWEDATPYRENEAISGYWQAFMRGPTEQLTPAFECMVNTAEPRSPFTHARSGFDLSPHHAVCGQRALRLCVYKCCPVLFVSGEPLELEQFVTATYETWTDRDGVEHKEPSEWAGEYTIAPAEGAEEVAGVYRFAAEFDTDRLNFCDVALIEPDGVRWSARGGIYYGAGYEDDAGEPQDVVTLLPKTPA